MSITIIAAIGTNNVIGTDNDLPWHIPEDLKHFKNITTRHTVLMGRKTWESIPQKFRPLPNRKNIIITTQTEYTAPEGVLIYHSLEKAFANHKTEQLFVIGGGNIYHETIPYADTLYITKVPQIIDGDTFFPEINLTIWEKTEEKQQGELTFITYKRI